VATGLFGLSQFQAQTITIGDIGDGEKAWGDGSKASSFEKVSTTNNIAKLTGPGTMDGYTGFRPNYVPKPSMAKYIARLQELADPSQKPTIIEIHLGVPIKRGVGKQDDTHAAPKRTGPT
jgi:hypothetical protein